MGLLERITAAGGARPVVVATLVSCIGLIAPCNRVSAPGPGRWPVNTGPLLAMPTPEKRPGPDDTSPDYRQRPAPPLPSARGKTFTIEAERRLKECQGRPEPFTERVDAYRGKS
jgi:hypothetical protein